MKASSESGLWPRRILSGAWAGTSQVYRRGVPKPVTQTDGLPYNPNVGDTFTRVGTDSNIGYIVFYIWTPILLLLSLRTTLKLRKKPTALAFYSLGVAVL